MRTKGFVSWWVIRRRLSRRGFVYHITGHDKYGDIGYWEHPDGTVLDIDVIPPHLDELERALNKPLDPAYVLLKSLDTEGG